jgi:TolB-like protein
MIGSTSDDAGLGDGMAIDLIYLLSRIAGLSVPAHAESGRYEGSQMSPATIAKELKVDHILKGYLTMEGNTLRVNAESMRSPITLFLHERASPSDSPKL